MKNNIGILLTNIGTPDAPTPPAVRRYLKTFLSDRRVVEIPRLLWLPILHGWILPIRSRKSAKLYQKIWGPQGSPLLNNSRKLADRLEKKLQIPVALGMHYGNPSIKDALITLQKKNIKKIIVLPLYPQYSATTTASTFDYVASVLKNWRNVPEIHFLNDYADHPLYVRAIARSIQTAEKQFGKSDKLLFSFHGIPKRFIEAGDIYQERCQITVDLVAKELNFSKEKYALSFQSRLGRAEWLKPYTDETLKVSAAKHIQVICPGFAVDCLETLEEIAIQGKKQFLNAGGEMFHYIQALNDSDEHVEMLVGIITSSLNK